MGGGRGGGGEEVSFWLPISGAEKKKSALSKKKNLQDEIAAQCASSSHYDMFVKKHKSNYFSIIEYTIQR